MAEARYSPEYLKDVLGRLKDPKHGIKTTKKQVEKKKKIQCAQGSALIEWLLRDLGERSIISKAEVIAVVQALLDRQLIRPSEGSAGTFSEAVEYCFPEESLEALEMEVLLKDTEHSTMEAVAASMGEEGTGVPVSIKKHRLKKYKNTFSGSEAVSWFSSNLNVTKTEDCIALGQLLQNNGLIINVLSKTEPFSDKSSTIYRLSGAAGDFGSLRGMAAPSPVDRNSSPARSNSSLSSSTESAESSPTNSATGVPAPAPRPALQRPPSVRGRGRGMPGAARPPPAATRGAPPVGARGAPPRARGVSPRAPAPQRGFVQGRGQPGRGRRQAPLLGQSERRAAPPSTRAPSQDSDDSPAPPPRVRPPPRAASATLSRNSPTSAARVAAIPPPSQPRPPVTTPQTDDFGSLSANNDLPPDFDPLLDEPPDAAEIGGLTKPTVPRVLPSQKMASSGALPPPPVVARSSSTAPRPTPAARPPPPSAVSRPAVAPPAQEKRAAPPVAERAPPAGAPATVAGAAGMKRTPSAQWSRPAPRRSDSVSDDGKTSPGTGGAVRKPTAPARDISVTIGKPVDELGVVKQQLLTSEQAFVNSSFACLKAYCQDVDETLFSTKEKEVVFANMSDIVEMHFNILSTVNDATRPSDIILQMVPHLHMYLGYLASSVPAVNMLAVLRERPGFADVLQRGSAQGLTTIETFLEAPSRRLDDLPTLINDFIQRLASEPEEQQRLSEALDKFERLQSQKNTRKMLPEHLMRIWDIQHSFPYEENVSFDLETAKLIFEGSMTLKSDTRGNGGSGDTANIFIFEHVTICGRRTAGHFLQCLIKTPRDQLIVRDVPSSQASNALELQASGRSIVLELATPKEKRLLMNYLPVRYVQPKRMGFALAM